MDNLTKGNHSIQNISPFDKLMTLYAILPNLLANNFINFEVDIDQANRSILFNSVGIFEFKN